MPKFTKCWYKFCDSDNREDPNLLFYKFPRDSERCEQWINNCANPELMDVWKTSPERVMTLRVCQKHFLKEFLGSSSRLVGHAVPAPFGVSLDQIDAKKFMVECASLKSTSDITRQKLICQSQPPAPQNINCSNSNQPSIDRTSTNQNFSGITRNFNDSGLLVPINHTDNFRQLVNDSTNLETNSNILTSSCKVQYITPFASSRDQSQQRNTPSNFRLNENASLGPSRMSRNTNPIINYDRDGKVVSIKYPDETLSMIKTRDNEQHAAHVLALKHKIRHYQRKLAVLNHRYQKLKTQIKGRSNKMRLLENLKICKADFDPCVFEIFKRQIKGPSSKHGNRWSNDVKLFSSSIYLRSRSAYKFIRKTVDLPSESIVKRFIVDRKLSKLTKADQDGEEEDQAPENSIETSKEDI